MLISVGRTRTTAGGEIPMDRDAWNSHQWSTAQGRRIELNPGNPIIQHHCSLCHRDFVEDPTTGGRYAVYVSVFTIWKLPEQVSRHWLGEFCPGSPVSFDVEIRSKLIENLGK
jgi:hypothetical protein